MQDSSDMEESLGNDLALFDPFFDDEIMETEYASEIVSYIEQNASIFDLIQRHSLCDSRVSSQEHEDFIRPIDDDEDIGVTLASLKRKISYIRKNQGGYVPFNKFLSADAKRTEGQSAIDERSRNPVAVSPPLPLYVQPLFYHTLVRPLTYIEFLKLMFPTLLHLYVRSKADLRRILDPHRSLLTGVSRLNCVEATKVIEVQILANIGEFLKHCGKCETLGRHFVDVMLNDSPFEYEGFKGERLTCDYLEHKLGYLEYLVDQTVSLLCDYLEKIYELSLHF